MKLARPSAEAVNPVIAPHLKQQCNKSVLRTRTAREHDVECHFVGSCNVDGLALVPRLNLIRITTNHER